MLRKVLIAASALISALVTLTLVALLGTVTHADAVGYSDWVDATKVTDPLPGRTFVNRLGESVPAVLWVAKVYFHSDQPTEGAFDIGYRLQWRKLEREFAPLSALAVGLKRILHERDMEQIRQHASSAKIAELRRLEGCANAIVQTFHHGLDVCQLTEVIKESTGRILAVRFGTHCLTLDPAGGPRPLPDLEASSFWTSVKLTLGLVDQLLAAPVVAGNETG